MRRAAAVLMLGWLVVPEPWVTAQTSLIPPGHVKVTVEFRQEGQGAQSGVAVKGRGTRVQVQGSQQTTRRNVESFLLVRDGGEARITVVEQVPEVVWFQQYALRHRYITEAVVFRQVGTFLAVRPTILPDKRIRVKITPQISYRGDQSDGMIELVEAATEVVVERGSPITIGGTEGVGEAVRQFLLGYERVHQANQVRIILTAQAP